MSAIRSSIVARRDAVALAVTLALLVPASGCTLFGGADSRRDDAPKTAAPTAPPRPADEELVGPPVPEGLGRGQEIVGPPAPPEATGTRPPAPAPPPKLGAADPGKAVLASLERHGIAAHASSRGVVIVLPETVFDYGTADLPRESRKRLRELARTIVEQAAGTRVSVEGHTDSIGAELYNKGLSERRAKAVAAELAAGGVAQRLITAAGYGSERPIAPNARADGSDDAQGRARNRRVEVVVETGPAGAL
jgi:outer membrane protein OmpA-like peptidoglycan-associated protein